MTLLSLTILIGATVPRPAPSGLTEAIDRVEVTQSDEGRSGFQIALRIGRSEAADLLDYPLLRSSLLDPFTRVMLIVTLNARPLVLIDGVITRHEFVPSNEPGESRLMITGEDVSVMMDLEEKIVAHPAQNAAAIVTKIIASYAKYGLVPKIIPSLSDKPPLPIDRIPVQHDTDLAYVQRLAQRHGYVFYIQPGLVPGVNTAYWGPPSRLGVPQPALSVNLDSSTNVESIRFQYDSLAATLVEGATLDRDTNRTQPIATQRSQRLPLARDSALRSQSHLRKILPGIDGQSQAIAQAVTDASLDRVVVAEGELDVVQYGNLLQARGVVGVRGVGDSYSGSYYVKRVTHILEQGGYRQRFTLVREGLGTLMPLVRP